ncbi:glutamate racemase [Helcococcus kunzii]|uniref:Glutamate racemase n=1 Tax=Helcococcus kunzii ATCC 51366 TaxID=883114 RepID=H3NLA3_9FIRM|nr:glutamate racemase [Helcococcus kunzii]EHR36084.1 glutamate racemase [Helcococcus kunzii ATCC 51366]MCT1796658.1 glutamate racemase [Helcococcus kunzii]MCT1988698.1 glutamate racemase [Helcococcus kunzii]QUY64118.1 glutamate racemase [Helcococcus kunzii]
MDKRNMPIGVFDSGIGGITVLKELKRVLPNENYIYLGDLKNSPYGEKTGDQVFEFTKNNINFLISKNVKLIVFACNTASSYRVEELRDMFDVPIITIIESAINTIDIDDKKILLAATKATVNSHSYNKKMQERNIKSEIYSQACSELVPHIEAGDLSQEETQHLVDSYIKKYRDKEIDFLLLGCTHYPIWRQYFSNAIGEKTKIIDPAIQIAQDVKALLENEQLSNVENTSDTAFYVTADLEKFHKNINLLLGDISKEKIKLVHLK